MVRPPLFPRNGSGSAAATRVLTGTPPRRSGSPTVATRRRCPAAPPAGRRRGSTRSGALPRPRPAGSATDKPARPPRTADTDRSQPWSLRQGEVEVVVLARHESHLRVVDRD